MSDVYDDMDELEAKSAATQVPLGELVVNRPYPMSAVEVARHPDIGRGRAYILQKPASYSSLDGSGCCRTSKRRHCSRASTGPALPRARWSLSTHGHPETRLEVFHNSPLFCIYKLNFRLVLFILKSDIIFWLQLFLWLNVTSVLMFAVKCFLTLLQLLRSASRPVLA